MSRERLIRELEDWRIRHNAQWALNLSLGVSPLGRFDPDASFKPHLRKLMRQLSCEVFGVPRRQVQRLTSATAPFFAGLYESHDRFGQPWPHIHGAIALGGHSEALLRGVLRDRWGYDRDPAKPAVISVEHIAVPSPSPCPPSCPSSCSLPCRSSRFAARGVVNRPDYRPSFSLTPIFSPNWLGGYASKLSRVHDVSVWTTPEIMNLAA